MSVEMIRLMLPTLTNLPSLANLGDTASGISSMSDSSTSTIVIPSPKFGKKTEFGGEQEMN